MHEDDDLSIATDADHVPKEEKGKVKRLLRREMAASDSKADC